MSEEIHISSLVLHVIPPHVEGVLEVLSGLEGLEVAVTESKLGKIVVVLERSNTREINDCIENLKIIDGVLSVAMVYHHVEDTQLLKEEIA
ncbi:MAG: chaperone NapD [Agarilytica sp.]